MDQQQKSIYRLKRVPQEQPNELLQIKTDENYKPSKKDPFDFIQNQLKSMTITDQTKKALYLKRIDQSKFKDICQLYNSQKTKETIQNNANQARNKLLNQNRQPVEKTEQQLVDDYRKKIIMEQQDQVNQLLKDKIIDDQKIQKQRKQMERNLIRIQEYKEQEKYISDLKQQKLLIYNLNTKHDQLFCNDMPLEVESVVDQENYDYYMITKEQINEQIVIPTVYFDENQIDPNNFENDIEDQYDCQQNKNSENSYDPNDPEDYDSNHEDFENNDYPDEESSERDSKSDDSLDFRQNFMQRIKNQQQQEQQAKTIKYQDQFDSFQ